MKTLNKSTLITTIATLTIGVLLGWLLFSGSNSIIEEEHSHTESSVAETIWTCSMHPQIRKNEAGKCPICGMELIPLESAEGEFDQMAVSMSPTAMKLAHVETLIVGQGNPEKSIHLNGKVQADERLVFTQSSHIEGRIEELTVNFTGEYVSNGQVIAYIYSPDLVTAQEELLEAQKSMETQPSFFQAAKEKLKNWKLTDKQIDQILASNKPAEQFPILSNVSGYVTMKMVNSGDYIKQGQAIYEIANLSRVWVLFEVYESDMSWIRKGDKVSYSLRSLPGETFTGTISYLDPVVNPKTRVALARVEVRNTDLKLKPEMFVSGTVESIIKSKPSSIIIPKTAVMWTGKRSVVYVMDNTSEGISFLMREVTLGPEMGEGYMIESGLIEGEEIAVNGTFSIDAAAQLAGKPSMMNPEGGAMVSGHNHANIEHEEPASMQQEGQEEMPTNSIDMDGPVDMTFREQLTQVYRAQLDLQKAFLSSDASMVSSALPSLESTLNRVDMNLLKGEMHNHWMTSLQKLNVAIEGIKNTTNIMEQRVAYSDFNDALYEAIKIFGTRGEVIYYQFCPMANNNKGAYWLANQKDIQNPYYGDAMLTCGETKEVIR